MIKKARSILLLLAVAGLLFVSGWAIADSSYQISWFSVDSGGGQSEGGDYAVNGTIGQPDAGLTNGGVYGVRGGFWQSQSIGYSIYLPMVIKFESIP